jgi:uncharacterized protein
MQYRQVTKNGDKLSVLGFGCMRLPMKDGAIDEARAIKQIRSAIDSGVNYVDTAWPYHAGQSERVLGLALKDGYREKVKLATKLPSWLLNSRSDMDLFLDTQLKKLGTDHVDYYLLHALDGGLWDRVNALGALEFLDKAKADGRIVNAGFSFHGLNEDFTRIVDAYDWTFCQIQYNYLDTEYQAGTKGLKYAASKRIAVIVMEPLRGGNLALPQPPPEVAAIWNESKTRRSPAEWALRWLWSQPEVTTVLSGMNDEANIAENLAVASSSRPGELSDEELKLVERAARKYHELMKVACTGCGYCMPCPKNVMIPMCFEEYNKYGMFGGLENSKFVYAFRLSGLIGDGKPGYASQCVRCGACMKKCPQRIKIPDALAEIAATFEDAETPARLAEALKIFKVKPS